MTERALVDTDNPIEQAWYQFCKDNLDPSVTVTFAQELSGQDAPRPVGSYVTLNVISGPITKGMDELRKSETTDFFDITGERQYTLTIEAFRSGSRTNLEKLQLLLDSSVELKKLKESEADIAVVERGAVTNIAALLGTGFERRHSMDVVFNSSVKLETDIEPIESARISGTVSGGKEGDQTRSVDVSKP